MKAAVRSTKERFEELTDKITRLIEAQEVTPEAVHRLRTTARRIESILRFHDSADDSATRKTLRRLKRLRQSAGEVRDCDVMQNLLSTVDCDRTRDRKRVHSAIVAKRERLAAKLSAKIAKQNSSDLVARIKKLPLPDEHHLRSSDQYVAGAITQFIDDATGFAELNEQNLHDFRMVCKRARYVAELAGDDEIAVGLRTELKAMQDAIGEWHDWVQLTELADRALSRGTSPLLVAIRAVRRAKLKRALAEAARGREQISLLHESRVSSSKRKPPSGIRRIYQASSGLRLLK